MRVAEVSVSIAHVVEGELADPREAIRWVRSLPARDPSSGGGCPWVQLDAMRKGLRPRDLGRSGRRDLAAYLRRQELMCSGLDLWIPAAHFADARHVDRAVMAVHGACELAADLDVVRRVVSVALPASVGADVVEQIRASGERFGVRVADHGPADVAMDERLGRGVDPASCSIAGQDPVARVLGAGEGLASARLSDLSVAGRTVPGSESGRLDLLSYGAALGVVGYGWPVVVDLRGLPDVMETAPRILRSWRECTAFPVG